MTMQPELRRCAAVRCHEQVKRHLLMCPRHWAQVPASIQTEVFKSLRAWRDGASENRYMLAVYRAQLVVVEHEGIPYRSSILDKIATLEGRIARGEK